MFARAGGTSRAGAPAGDFAPSRRLDLALVDRGLARSRTHAQRILAEGRVRLAGRPATKASAPVGPADRLEVVDVPDGVEYASRAAHKLLGALEELDLSPRGLRCLDAGASTGGFTDVLLRRGASRVLAVDIGHDQLAPHLAADPRVEVRDGVNLRDLCPRDVDPPVDLTVADLSFISLRTVLPALHGVTRPDGALLLMVKPQFEVGRRALPKGGVVTDPRARRDAVLGVVETAHDLGLGLEGAGRSRLPGQDGNVECFIHLRGLHSASPDAQAVYDMIERATGASEADRPGRSAAHGPGRGTTC
ncbi:TlyA family RNA methyltransferase [Brachybacterium sillae]|uniref:TlyA family RNA methyltransferase n=1 Tax=Brachybacterium sillae TaxID=2810536 RepID=UPI00217E9BCE|nr:TlyA family RNA methyltransferase [Brachybacterium sillae]